MLKGKIKYLIYSWVILLTLFSCNVKKGVSYTSLKKETKSDNNSNTVAPSILIEKKEYSLAESYDTAFNRLKYMLANKDYNFKQAVFEVENAYYNQQLLYDDYSYQIEGLTSNCKLWMKLNTLPNYTHPDSLNVLKNYSIFTTIKDTIFLFKNFPLSLPFTYDFEDFFGKNDWTKMFVNKLLVTNSGNCHSLPYLYKILADELGAKCWLSLAPNHLYIKNNCKKMGWYNTELTSGQFPTDAWIKASGYISLDGIRSGIYMDTLSAKQSIALCLYDLALGYSKQTATPDNGFILQCCDLILTEYPSHINTIILKAETLKRQFDIIMVKNNTQTPSEVFYIPEAKKMYDEMEGLYVSALKMGFYEMPEEMYINWLTSVQNQKNVYENN